MGGFTIGSQVLGMQTVAFVEKNELACVALRANFSAPIFQGDLADMDLLKQVHRLKEDHFLQVTGGFPCQGYLVQGDHMGLDDVRIHCLYHILTWAWFLQADAVLLECVANVMQFANTQDYLDRFARDANMHAERLVFDLKLQWPARRNGFWRHMISKEFSACPLPGWTVTPEFARLRDIMPMDAMRSAEDEYPAWDQHELALSQNPIYGSDQRILQHDDQAPTVLHSWGHVARACSCGCQGPASTTRWSTRFWDSLHMQRSTSASASGGKGFDLLSASYFHLSNGAEGCTVLAGENFCSTPGALGSSSYPRCPSTTALGTQSD